MDHSTPALLKHLYALEDQVARIKSRMGLLTLSQPSGDSGAELPVDQPILYTVTDVGGTDFATPQNVYTKRVGRTTQVPLGDSNHPARGSGPEYEWPDESDANGSGLDGYDEQGSGSSEDSWEY